MRISDFIELSKEEIKETKIHFATGNKSNNEALNEFIKGTFQEWQEWQNKKSFERRYILALIYLNSKEWLLQEFMNELLLKKNKINISTRLY